jgi:hypothetical protein
VLRTTGSCVKFGDCVASLERRHRGLLPVTVDCGIPRGPIVLACRAILGELLDPSGVVDEVRDWRRERRTRQRARVAEIPCALRVVDRAHPGLGRRWTRGAARVPPGALVFEPDTWRRPRMTSLVRSASLQPPGDIPQRRSSGR